MWDAVFLLTFGFAFAFVLGAYAAANNDRLLGGIGAIGSIGLGAALVFVAEQALHVEPWAVVVLSAAIGTILGTSVALVFKGVLYGRSTNHHV